MTRARKLLLPPPQGGTMAIVEQTTPERANGFPPDTHDDNAEVKSSIQRY